MRQVFLLSQNSSYSYPQIILAQSVNKLQILETYKFNFKKLYSIENICNIKMFNSVFFFPIEAIN